MSFSSLWRFLPPKLAHDLSPFGLKIFSDFCEIETPQWKSFSWNDLHFANPLGLSGGVDKNGDSIECWQKLGAGFIEIGTITPRPQKPNPGKILDRDWDNKNLWNKMGFPNAGAKEVRCILENTDYKVPLFINVGKNRDTANSKAAGDYVDVIKELEQFADVFVVNISSPNTKNLRDLQNKDSLQGLLQPIRHCTRKPILVKLSPDLSNEQLSEAVEVGLALGTNGFILTNTTIDRPEGCPFPKEGGLSGRDLYQKSISCLKNTVSLLGAKKNDQLLVSVGGVLTPEQVFERLNLGADLVQVYSALTFDGPLFFRHTADVATKKGLS